MPIVCAARMERSAGFGIAEDEDFGWPQLQADLARGGGVIDMLRSFPKMQIMKTVPPWG
jgi:hypothetical protein